MHPLILNSTNVIKNDTTNPLTDTNGQIVNDADITCVIYDTDDEEVTSITLDSLGAGLYSGEWTDDGDLVEGEVYKIQATATSAGRTRIFTFYRPAELSN